MRVNNGKINTGKIITSKSISHEKRRYYVVLTVLK